MHRRLLLAATASTALLAPGLPASAQGTAQGTAQGMELSGVKYPPTVALAGSTLQLNGAGIRYRFIIKVYTAGLYTATKAATPEAALGQGGPKRLHVVMLRDIDGNELGKLFTRGMQDNASKEDFSKSIPGTLRIADIFAVKKKLQAGENFTVDYIPGWGTVVSVNGKPQGEPIREPEFFTSLMRIWLGSSPADRLLKDALLGHAPPPNPGSSMQ